MFSRVSVTIWQKKVDPVLQRFSAQFKSKIFLSFSIWEFLLEKFRNINNPRNHSDVGMKVRFEETWNYFLVIFCFQ